MPSPRIGPLLVFAVFLHAGPAETAPWQQGTVGSVTRRQDTQRTDQPSPRMAKILMRHVPNYPQRSKIDVHEKR